MTRVLPRASRPRPEGAFEHLMAWGRHLPGAAGHACYRALKRRVCKRPSETFAQVLAETGPGDLCIDLGANVGEITATLAKTGADVICFEPDPLAFELLEKRCAGLANVTLHQKAASVENTQMMLRRSVKWDNGDTVPLTVRSSIMDEAERTSDADGVMVEVIDFPAFLTALDRDVRILKMDIEGAEWDILQALMDHPILSRIDAIFVETHERFDPARLIPVFEDLQDRAERLERPYINLFWA